MGAVASPSRLRRSACSRPPRKKSCRLERSPRAMPNEARSASTWCQGTPWLWKGRAKNFEAEADACQNENELPIAGSETRKETAKRWPRSLEMLRTNLLASDQEYVSD